MTVPVGVLTLSPANTSPFPYSAIAIAAYTGKARIVFDESSDLELKLDGSTFTNESDIVRALAEAGGLPGDSTKVCQI
jgi:glutamyl-tRNA synthetase